MTQGTRKAVAAFGIDLGTTNSALAAVCLPPHPGAGVSEPLPILQRVSATAQAERPTLPSALFLDADGAWFCGEFARAQCSEFPLRGIQSAKSWLANRALGIGDTPLPAEAPEGTPQLSPVEAASQVLRHLRDCAARFLAERFPAADWQAQVFTITVPASFDPAARNATLEAARDVGFPMDRTHLLEEPKAALLRFAEAARAGAPFARGYKIAVLDVGGGTTDFAVFVADGAGGFARTATSNHTLLGGDNIDLAAAHALEALLCEEGAELPPHAWAQLLTQARALKETAFASTDGPAAALKVSVSTASGAGLLGQVLSAELAAADLRALLLDGFFPVCRSTDLPAAGRSALQEWGLPFATDFAVTRYLAEFLRPHLPVDALLFNGGSLAAPAIRERLLDVVSAWQDSPPADLQNPEPTLAVARGAALHAAACASPETAAPESVSRAVLLNLATQAGAQTWALALPAGQPVGQWYTCPLQGLQLTVNAPARFAAALASDQAVFDANATFALPADARPLPALQARITLDADSTAAQLAVTLRARLNEFGAFEIALDGPAESPGPFALSFDVRAAASDAAPLPTSAQLQATVPEGFSEALSSVVRASLRPNSGVVPSPAKLLRAMAPLADAPVRDWPVPTLRAAADVLRAECFAASSAAAADARSALLHCMGFCLRPGFGHADDPARLRHALEIALRALEATAARVKVQAAILLRRIAHGLAAEAQHAILDALHADATTLHTLHPEALRLLGALCAIDTPTRLQLCEAALAALQSNPAHPAELLALLAGQLERWPPPGSTALPIDAAHCERLSVALLDFNPAAKGLQALPDAVLRCSRLTDTPCLNLSRRVRAKAKRFLDKAGWPAHRLSPLDTATAPSRAETAAALGDALPIGLQI